MQVKTKNMAFAGIVGLLVVVLWYQFLYAPMVSQESSAKDKASDTEKSVAQLKKQLDGETPGKGGSKQASLEELQAAFPKDPNVTEFLREVQGIRDAIGIPAAFQSIVPSQPTTVGGVAAITVGINVQGNYQQMRDYVDKLNSLTRLVVIDNVSVTAGQDPNAGSTTGGPTGEVFAAQGSAPMLQVTVSARLFMSAPPKVAAGTTSGATPATGASGSGAKSGAGGTVDG